MSNDRIEELEKQLSQMRDTLAGIERVTSAFGGLLVEADYVTKTKGLNPKTISQNDKIEKFNEFGRRKVLIEIKSVAAIKQRKTRRKPGK